MSEVLRIGVDVGGTNTDAVLLRGRTVLASHKSPTTPDVGSGVVGAITEVLKSSETAASAISAVMIGTTHFTNALVEAQHLCRVGVLRLGAPATLAIRPMADWPATLRETVHGHTEIIGGGFNYDGRPITPLDPAEVKRAAREFAARGIESVAITAVFAPVNTAQEQEAADILQQEHALGTGRAVQPDRPHRPHRARERGRHERGAAADGAAASSNPSGGRCPTSACAHLSM